MAASAAVKVVVIDDDDDFRRSLVRILTYAKYSCVEAASGTQALALLADEHNVAVAMCDIKMSGMSGLDLLSELIARVPDIAVVMTTVVDDPAVAARAFELGAVGYLTKPFETNELLIQVAGALRWRRIQSAQRTRVRALEERIANTQNIGGTLENPRDDALQRIRVLVVDDHEIFAQSLVRLLANQPQLEVVGSAHSVASALAAALEHSPDVVLMDFELPDGDGPEATEMIKG